jgi:hypothetical protein
MTGAGVPCRFGPTLAAAMRLPYSFGELTVRAPLQGFFDFGGV